MFILLTIVSKSILYKESLDGSILIGTFTNFVELKDLGEVFTEENSISPPNISGSYL